MGAVKYGNRDRDSADHCRVHAYRGGHDIWRTRPQPRERLLPFLAYPGPQPLPADLSEEIRTTASDLGTVGERFLEACRRDLQGESNGISSTLSSQNTRTFG